MLSRVQGEKHAVLHKLVFRFKAQRRSFFPAAAGDLLHKLSLIHILDAALETVKGSNIAIGAENCHWEPSGAYTGEISAPMLAAMQVPYVIIGHSERRTYFGETDVTVNKRVRAALDNGLTVIQMCIRDRS